MQSMSAREFNRDVSAAKRAAEVEPLVITDRGSPAFVLVSIDEYRRMRNTNRTLADALWMDEHIEIEFEPATLKLELKDPEL